MQNKEHSYHPWIQTIVVVQFDLDQGQKVLLAVPDPLPPLRDKQISMLAFPDSNACPEHQTLYKYIFKTSQDQLAFVCFKQKKDETNKRGYSQKSFVIVTRLPFLTFFQQLSEFLVFKLYSLSNEQLQQQLIKLYQQTQEWPQPEPLSTFSLPVLDYSINALIPNYLFNSGTGFVKAQNFPNNIKKQKPSSIEQGVTQEVMRQLGRYQQVRLTEVFQGKQQQIWNLWQGAMLNRAIMLMALTPYLASQAVLATASLTNPIQYSGQIHPYVTVYDSHLNDLQAAQQNVLLGATNPLFNKLFSKGKIELIQVSDTKNKKHLKPVKQLFVVSTHQHQRHVNQSALRKYFYKINCGILTVVEEYLEEQTNDLKFFNPKEFIRFVRKREAEDPLDQILDGKKGALTFWEEFISSRNFLSLLRSKNVVRSLN